MFPASMANEASTSKGGRASKYRDPANMPWVEKYRPNTLDDVAAHKEIISTIKTLTAQNRLPHLLLYGPPGKAPELQHATVIVTVSH